MKKFRPILGISLMVQSLTFFILCLLNIEKKKGLAKAFGALSAVGGIAGAILIAAEVKERKLLKGDEDEFFDDFDEFFDEFDEIDEAEIVDDDDVVCSFETQE